MTRDELINFIEIQNIKRLAYRLEEIPPRPSEWNIPQIIKTIFENMTKHYFK